MTDIDIRSTNIRRAVESGNALEAANILCSSSINEWNEISKRMTDLNRKESREFVPNIVLKDVASFSVSERFGYAVIPLLTVDREFCRNVEHSKSTGKFDRPLKQHF